MIAPLLTALILASDSRPPMRHHALETRVTNFYAVCPPPGFDASGKRKYALCVILHGRGSTETGHGGPISEALNLPGVICIAPRAPYPHHDVFRSGEPGYTAWPEYPEGWGHPDSAGFPKEEIKGMDPVRQYTDWIAACVADARKKYPIREGKITVVGHSQGATFAERFAVAHPQLVQAYAAYAGRYREAVEDSLSAKAHREGKVFPLLLHCEGDSQVPVASTRGFSAYLEKHRIPHAKEIYPGGDHGIGPKPMAAIRDFISRQADGVPAPPLKAR